MPQFIKRVIYAGIFIVVLISGLLFFMKNNQVIEFNYIIGTIQLPVSLLLFASLFTGIVLGVSASLPVILHLGRKKSRLEKQIRMTEQEVNNLRALPVRNAH